MAIGQFGYAYTPIKKVFLGFINFPNNGPIYVNKVRTNNDTDCNGLDRGPKKH